MALKWWEWSAQQLKAGRNDARAASRWQCAELGWPTSALGMLEWLPSPEQDCSEMRSGSVVSGITLYTLKIAILGSAEVDGSIEARATGGALDMAGEAMGIPSGI